MAKLKYIKIWIAWKLVWLAKYIYPESKAVKEFYTDRMYDLMIEGKYVSRVDFNDFYINAGSERSDEG